MARQKLFTGAVTRTFNRWIRWRVYDALYTPYGDDARNQKPESKRIDIAKRGVMPVWYMHSHP